MLRQLFGLKIINKHTLPVLLLLACNFYPFNCVYGLFKYYQEGMGRV